jgi:capsular polysaccharide transport system ATP-binding protein
MSIRLTDIHVAVPFQGAKVPVFKGLSLEVPDGAHVGVLGLPKSGKTTLLQVVCGTAAVDQGSVERTSRTSWPIPLSTFFVNSSSVACNVRFLARLYGIADENFPRRIAELADIVEFLEVPLAKCPKFVRPRLAFGLGIGVDFDVYLFDGTLAPADKDFKARAAEIVGERLKGCSYVVATTNPKEVEQNCDSVYVLEAGQARYFGVASEGVEYFKQLVEAQKQKDAADKESNQAEASEDDTGGVGDIDILASAIADEVE